MGDKNSARPPTDLSNRKAVMFHTGFTKLTKRQVQRRIYDVLGVLEMAGVVVKRRKPKAYLVSPDTIHRKSGGERGSVTTASSISSYEMSSDVQFASTVLSRIQETTRLARKESKQSPETASMEENKKKAFLPALVKNLAAEHIGYKTLKRKLKKKSTITSGDSVLSFSAAKKQRHERAVGGLKFSPSSACGLPLYSDAGRQLLSVSSPSQASISPLKKVGTRKARFNNIQ